MTWLIVLLVTAAALIGGGLWLSNAWKDILSPGLSLGCRATVEDKTYALALDQAENAALISALAVERGMPARAASIALATALQESKLRNISYGDLDSVGLFQQRPSQGWGTVEEIMDPTYSATAFYEVLAQVPNYVDLPVNDAAQIVQRSGYPHAYAQHEQLSRAFASALTGQTPQGLNCTLAPATSGAAPEDVIAAAQSAGSIAGTVRRDAATASSGSTVLLEVPDASGWMLAHWVLANAEQFGIVEVSYADQTWNRDAIMDGHNAGWQGADSADPERVTIRLAAVPAAG